VERGVLIRALSPQTVSLEDLFFSLTEGSPPAKEPATEPAAIGSA